MPIEDQVAEPGETFFAEMKRYVDFTERDEEALRLFAPHAEPHLTEITNEFYARAEQHPQAAVVFTGPAQIERLRCTLVEWMSQLLVGPWDEEYYLRRLRIGRVHVTIGLSQRYMLSAMNLIRIALARIVNLTYADNTELRLRTVTALHRILDLELAIMLDSYREASVERMQQLERVEKSLLERRLAISEARYEEIVEKGEAVIVTAAPNGRIRLFNRRAEEITGIDRAEAAERTWMAVFAHGADEDVILARLLDVLSGRRVMPYEGTVRCTGGRERRVRWHFTTLPDANEPMLCAMGIDVTEEHELAVRTQRAERLASLGTMAAGLAHEIRNPLNAAHLQLTLPKRRLQRDSCKSAESAGQAADLAAKEMRRLAILVDEFLQFARPQPLRRASGDLRSSAAGVVELLRPEAATSGVEITLTPGAPLMAQFDEEKIKQVLLNLVRNAVEAAGRGGRVEVRVRPQNGNAIVEVEDDGHGLPATNAPIFEPFFTTKSNGTGLGLAIVHRIVTDHNGRVDVSSRPGHTVFSVALPRSAGQIEI